MRTWRFSRPYPCVFLESEQLFYYTRQEQARYIDNNTIRFKAATLETYTPNDWCRANNISYVRADLVCLKDDYRPMGLREI